MAGTTEGIFEQSEDSNHYERLHRELIFDAFICPLTKQLMRDPVTLESGQTFERQAIEKWFEECWENGRRLICPVTFRELSSSELNPSIALKNAIEEWNARNEAAELDIARKCLSSSSSINDNIRALKFIQNLCLKNQSNKQVIRDSELIPMIVDLLKSVSRGVRCFTLETLRIVVEDDIDNKEMMAEGDTVRTIVKSLSREHNEKEQAVSLLYELSKMDQLCERIGAVNGAILLLVGITSSTSDDVATVQNADQTLENLARCENNVRQMAECGRLQPLLSLLIEGSPGTKLSMAGFLGELVLNSDVKVFAARTAGSSLINLMKSTDVESREAALRALNQISSDEASARILVQEGVLPPLVRDLFTAEPKQLPARLKEVSATILANIVNSGCEFDRVLVGSNQQTLVSEGIIHKLLHLINNTGPAIECKLLQVLVGLTTSSSYISSVVSAIQSSGATISLVQFIEAPQRDLRLASIKLLENLSPHMGSELASCLCSTSGQLESLIKIITENGGISEEQAAAVGFLSDLPETDTALTKKMLDEGVFQMFSSRIIRIRQGEVGRFITPYFEGLVKVLARVSFAVSEYPEFRALCRDCNLPSIFVDLLQANGMDNVQMVSATALENLSHESKNLSRMPDNPPPGFCVSVFPCISKPTVVTGLCRVHRGICSFNETFCLLEGQAVDKLVALLDHQNDKVVEASLGALCTLLEDGVNMEEGVQVLLDPSEGAKLILYLLLEARSESLRRRTVWAVERLLRNGDVADEVCCDQNISTALVDAYQHGDFRTRQIAECALKHVDRIPNFSGIFPNAGAG